VDWARTPDGRVFSNKPPGPSLIAFPVYWLLDQWLTRNTPDRAQRDVLRWRYKGRIQKTLAFIFQVVPLAFLMLYTACYLNSLKISKATVNRTLMAIAFGSTASVFMNTFFGHGMASVALLAFMLWLLSRKFCAAGFALGIAGLCDYGIMALAPGVFLALLPLSCNKFSRIFLGLSGPLIVFAAYHGWCFGGPFIPATRFQNPVFVEAVHYKLWGIFGIPSMEIFLKLLGGPERGLLFTVPWLLVLMPSVALSTWQDRASNTGVVARFSVVGLLGLLLLNASFNGWHGGLVPGPRYLCAIFPVWALWLGLSRDHLATTSRILVDIGLFVSCLLSILIFSTDLAVPKTPLWPYLWHAVGSGTVTTKARFVLLGFFGGIWILRILPKFSSAKKRG
jgi:hypothetical protein